MYLFIFSNPLTQSKYVFYSIGVGVTQGHFPTNTHSLILYLLFRINELECLLRQYDLTK